MINKLIELSVKNKFIVLLLIVGLIFWGAYSISKIPLDAVPDITNNQVQILTTSRNLSTEDVEQFITYPVELEMANLPGVQEIRSVSKFGLSVVTVVFDDDMGAYLPRQLIAEKLKSAQANIPEGFGSPEMGPITTGLGEIYQYSLDILPGYEDKYSLTDLRTIQDWIVKRQLSGIPGVVEVNTWGGKLKQYEIAVDPHVLSAKNISLFEVFDAIEQNNGTTGGGYIEKNNQAYFIRGQGLVESLEDIENIVVKKIDGYPILIRDIASVGFGYATPFGAITGNGEGEKVMGQVMLLKDANTGEVIESVKERVAQIEKNLPEGIVINPFLERTELIDKTIFTVVENLVLGALIVILVVILLLGNIRAGLLIASIIPLALLFALSMMNLFGISANLMSLGAVDFGIIIDGAIIIVEFVLMSMTSKVDLFNGDKKEKQEQKDALTIEKSTKMMRSAIFGQLIILIVFIPILALSGVEGKMFSPMAMTFCFALIGAMVLCLTYVPAMAAIFIRPVKKENRISKAIITGLERVYEPVLRFALHMKLLVLGLAAAILVGAFLLFNSMGGEFVPTLDEGDMVIQPIIPTGTSLSETIGICTKIETILLENFEEVDQVVSRIGAAEVPTDPMSMEEPDVIVKLKPKSQWVNTDSKDELIGMMVDKLSVIPGVSYEFTQPIEMRFNELITGVRADVAIKIYGDDLEILADKANEVKRLISGVKGAKDISVEKTEGLPQMLVRYDRQKLAQYDMNVNELNRLVQTAFGGATAGNVFEGEKRFDLVVRFDQENRNEINDISKMLVSLKGGELVPLDELAEVTYSTGPAKISRDDTKRRIVIGVNVRDRDMESVVDDIRKILDAQLHLPSGFSIEYGGQFENLNRAKDRLKIVVPIALVLIFILLYFTFSSVVEALLVYVAIPLAATGGVFLLWIRDLPFSISAGVGFIALFGIAVLNGIVLIEHYRELHLKQEEDILPNIIKATKQRMRPVLITASAAALGFFPMAISTSSGAEVQRPLATVVIGGLITATLLTLIVLPVLYTTLQKIKIKKMNLKRDNALKTIVVLIIATCSFSSFTQTTSIDMKKAVALACQNHPSIQYADLQVDYYQKSHTAGLDAQKLNINYGRGQINSSMIDYQWSVSQQFYFPTVYFSRSKLKDEKMELGKAYKDLQVNELTYEVRSNYNFILYLDQATILAKSLETEYAKFEEKARLKLESGSGTLLELNAASAKLQRVKLQLAEFENQRDLFKSNLQLLMNLEEDFEIADTIFEKLSLEIPDSSFAANNPMLAYYEQEINLSAQEVKFSRTTYLPDLTVGYMNQQIDGSPGLWSIYFGVNIPLFLNENSAEVQSRKIQKDMMVSQYEAAQLSIQALFNSYMNEYGLYTQRISYYENEGLVLANQIESSSKKAYFEGDVGYLEYVNGMEEALTIRQEYLSSLNNYNQVVLKLNYLMGK